VFAVVARPQDNPDMAGEELSQRMRRGKWISLAVACAIDNGQNHAIMRD
jgi:hypothetical protein